jgi:hypothetical protein
VKISTPSRPIRICGLRGPISTRAAEGEQCWDQPGGCKELFAKFDAYASVKGANNRVSEWHFGLTDGRVQRRQDTYSMWQTNLSGNSLDDPRKIMVLPLSVPGPRSEVAELAVITIVRQPHLRPDKEDFLVVNDDSAVVVYVLVDYRPATRSTNETRRAGRRAYVHSDVTDNSFSLLRCQYLCEDLPRMQHRITW